MRMNGDQERQAGKLVAVASGFGSACLSWRVMRGVRHLKMNQELQEFARVTLKKGLAKLGPEQHRVFKLMYAFHDCEKQRNWRKAAPPDMKMSVEEVVDHLPAEKLDLAMTQVKTTLERMGIA